MLDRNTKKIQNVDERRNIIIPGEKEETIAYCVQEFIDFSKKAIEKKGRFAVALSGGSTPKAIFQKLSRAPSSEAVAWDKVWLFWSDERSAPPEDPESNYHMAMEAGIKNLPIPKDQIFRMEGETNIVEKAAEYDQLIREKLGDDLFDFVMLGMGEDGHTASLFPETKALNIMDKWATANHVPQKDTWRMTLTYPCINQSAHISFYVLGEGKQKMLQRILYPPEGLPALPSEKIGTPERKALFIADKAAAGLL